MVYDPKLVPGSFSSMESHMNTNSKIYSYNLNNFINGWFIGNFYPTIYDTSDFEVSIKKYKKNDKEVKHCHKIAKEWTCVISGKVKFNENIFDADSIIVIEPFQFVEFTALEDTITVVIKSPSVKDDKYYL